jgi:hypothetical protein
MTKRLHFDAHSQTTDQLRESVKRYFECKFGEALKEAYGAMKQLTRSLTPSDLGEKAYSFYERFRPEIPPGKRGWGASGKLDLEGIRKIAGLNKARLNT